MKRGDRLKIQRSDKYCCPLCQEPHTITNPKFTWACGFSGQWDGDELVVWNICNNYELNPTLQSSSVIKDEKQRCNCDSFLLFTKGCQCGGI